MATSPRIVGVVLALVLAGTAAGAAATSGTPGVIRPRPSRVLAYPSYHAPSALRADGTVVAVVMQEAYELWDVASGRRIRGLGLCDTAVLAVAVAGRRAASICLVDTMSVKGLGIGVDYPRLVVVPGPAQTCVDGWPGVPLRPCMWFLTGHGDLLVFNVVTRDRRALWRIDAHGRTLLRTGAAAGPIRSVDNGRIAVQPGGSSVLILDRSGRTLRTFRLAARARLVALAPEHLVTLQAGRLYRHRLVDGRLTGVWQVDGRAEFLDSSDELAVYVSRGRIHVLRYADGRDARLQLPARRGTLLAQIEAAGLYYAYSTDPGEDAGVRVAFLPADELQRELG